MDFSNQTALITGASAGIGAAATRFLAGKGLRVILTARREDRLRTLAREIKAAGGYAVYYLADLGVEEQRITLFETIQEKHQSVDVLLNNAGFGWYGYFHQMPRQRMRDLLAVNVDAVAHLTSLFLPGMLAQGNGHIINIGSLAGGLPNQGIAMYGASKAFLEAFTTAIHRELRGSGVHASALLLGAVETEFYTRARKRPDGLPIPAEKLAGSVDMVNRALWRLLKRPRRVMYAPFYLRLAPPLFRLFAPVIDQVGPLLLKRKTDR